MPNPIDIHVGKQLRLRRMELSISQQALGKSLGITFQQIQKYERGVNRIGASRLFDLTNVLDVEVEYFFQGLKKKSARGRKKQESIVTQLTDSPYGIQLVRAFVKLNDNNQQKCLVKLVETMSNR